MTLAGMDDVETLRPHHREQPFDRFDRRPHQRQIVAHLVDIAADAAEIGLHVDDDQRSVLRAQIAIIGPRIRFGFDETLGHVSDLVYALVIIG